MVTQQPVSASDISEQGTRRGALDDTMKGSFIFTSRGRGKLRAMRVWWVKNYKKEVKTRKQKADTVIHIDSQCPTNLSYLHREYENCGPSALEDSNACPVSDFRVVSI
jgi:hypothetical protein